MKKKIIIIGLSCFFLITLSVTLCAAYFYQRSIEDSNIDLGNIDLVQKSFLIKEGEETLVMNTNEDNETYRINHGLITCYASQKGGYSDEGTTIQLNQLGVQFSFTNDIDAYVRIHIEDAWISRKVYNNNTINTNYIRRDETISSNSPFVTTEDWKVESDGYIYLKTMVSKSEEPKEYNFFVNPDYFYRVIASSGYRESILVQISYTVDIVQANRASSKWQIENIEEFLK